MKPRFFSPSIRRTPGADIGAGNAQRTAAHVRNRSYFVRHSDIDLLRDPNRVVDLYAEIPHCALDFSNARAKVGQLGGFQFAGRSTLPSFDAACVPNFAGSNPMLAIPSCTNRASSVRPCHHDRRRGTGPACVQLA